MEEKTENKVFPPTFVKVKDGVEMRFENDDSKFRFFTGLLKSMPKIQGVRCVSKGCEHNHNEKECCSMGEKESIVEIGKGGICLKFKSKGGENGNQ